MNVVELVALPVRKQNTENRNIRFDITEAVIKYQFSYYNISYAT